MKLSITTPFGEMNFEMPQEKASDIIQRAMQYAAEQPAKQPEVDAQKTPPSIPQAATESPKPIKGGNKPHRRVDSLFGDFKAPTTKLGEEQVENEEPQEYRGFLLIKCNHCGKIKGFCAKNPISQFTCECGGKTELHDLKPAFLKCKCGSQYKYKTNVTDERFDYGCLNCGSPVDMELNSRRNTYVTVSD